MLFLLIYTTWKVSNYENLPGTYFSVLGLKIYCVNLCIQSKYEKMQTRKNFVFGRFSHSFNYIK